jgi:VanZ family protein
VRRIAITACRFTLCVAVGSISYFATAPLEAVPFAGISDKVLHAGAFLTLAALVDFSFPTTAFGARKVAPLLAYGLAIEVVQHVLPFRTFSLLDWLADGAGVVFYVAVATPLLKRTPWIQRRWEPQVSQ